MVGRTSVTTRQRREPVRVFVCHVEIDPIKRSVELGSSEATRSGLPNLLVDPRGFVPKVGNVDEHLDTTLWHVVGERHKWRIVDAATCD